MAGRPPLDRERAWHYLLDLLGRRDYTVAELGDKLRRRGVGEPEVQSLLARLQELGLADDARYAELYVASRHTARGRLALRAELRRKGIDPAIVERELRPLSGDQQIAAATALLRRNAWRYRPGALADANPDPGAEGPADGRGEAADPFEARRAAAKERARAFAFLARRGFTADVASAALEAIGWWRDAP